jgi:hypothetical protein
MKNEREINETYTEIITAALTSGYNRGEKTRWYASGSDMKKLPSFLEVHIEFIEQNPISIRAREYETQKEIVLMRFGSWENFLYIVNRIYETSKAGAPYIWGD